ncbi:hypothetical protein FRB90_008764 [Tulasnella sp. 427]|nr:hypothetical protein FRB90_008764 [Tulasnella sp. 427]
MPVFSKIKTTLSAALALTSAVVHVVPLQSSALVGRDFQLSTHRRTLEFRGKVSRFNRKQRDLLWEQAPSRQGYIQADFKWPRLRLHLDPSAGKNQDVARVDAFYITNKVHDTFYKYGFTEQAFNFQDDNYGKGGKKGDRVEMQVQASGTNNANFATVGAVEKESVSCNTYLQR